MGSPCWQGGAAPSWPTATRTRPTRPSQGPGMTRAPTRGRTILFVDEAGRLQACHGVIGPAVALLQVAEQGLGAVGPSTVTADPLQGGATKAGGRGEAAPQAVT